MSRYRIPRSSGYRILQTPLVEQTVGFSRFTERTLTTLGEVKACTQRVLTQGYAVDDWELNDSVRCLAAPIHDSSGQLVAALGVTAPAAHFPKSDIPRVADQVKEHSRRCYAVLRGDSPATKAHIEVKDNAGTV